MFRTRQRITVGTLFLALFAIIWVRSRAEGTDIRYGDTVSGSLKAGTTETWHFVGNAGDVIALGVERTAGDLEPALMLEDLNNHEADKNGAENTPEQSQHETEPWALIGFATSSEPHYSLL